MQDNPSCNPYLKSNGTYSSPRSATSSARSGVSYGRELSNSNDQELGYNSSAGNVALERKRSARSPKTETVRNALNKRRSAGSMSERSGNSSSRSAALSSKSGISYSCVDVEPNYNSSSDYVEWDRISYEHKRTTRTAYTEIERKACCSQCGIFRRNAKSMPGRLGNFAYESESNSDGNTGWRLANNHYLQAKRAVHNCTEQLATGMESSEFSEDSSQSSGRAPDFYKLKPHEKCKCYGIIYRKMMDSFKLACKAGLNKAQQKQGVISETYENDNGVLKHSEGGADCKSRSSTASSSSSSGSCCQGRVQYHAKISRSSKRRKRNYYMEDQRLTKVLPKTYQDRGNSPICVKRTRHIYTDEEDNEEINIFDKANYTCRDSELQFPIDLGSISNVSHAEETLTKETAVQTSQELTKRPALTDTIGVQYPSDDELCGKKQLPLNLLGLRIYNADEANVPMPEDKERNAVVIDCEYNTTEQSSDMIEKLYIGLMEHPTKNETDYEFSGFFSRRSEKDDTDLPEECMEYAMTSEYFVKNMGTISQLMVRAYTSCYEKRMELELKRSNCANI